MNKPKSINFPDKIYLQAGDVPEGEINDYNACDEMSWCADEIFNCDVKYIRADLYLKETDRLRQLVRDIRDLKRSLSE